jgi:hypothetical protein
MYSMFVPYLSSPEDKVMFGTSRCVISGGRPIDMGEVGEEGKALTRVLELVS